MSLGFYKYDYFLQMLYTNNFFEFKTIKTLLAEVLHEVSKANKVVEQQKNISELTVEGVD